MGGTISLSGIPANALLFTNSSGNLTGLSALGVDDSGNLLVGTTTAQEQLTIDGAIYIGEETPATTSGRLYRVGADLFWNGSLVAASSSANWSINAGNVYRPTGSVGTGTSSPSRSLAVVGDAIITGALYDNSSNPGSN